MKRSLVLAGVLFCAASVHAQSHDGGTPTRLLDAPVQRAESAMEQVGRELRNELPADWKKPSVLQLERWQWGALPLLALAIAGLTLVFVRLTRRFIARLAKLQGGTTPDVGARGVAGSIAAVLSQLEGPLRLGWASLLARVGIPLLGLATATEASWERLFRVLFLVSFFWGAWRAVAAWTTHFLSSPYAQQHPGTRSLIGLLSRITRFALVAFGVLAALSEFGYSVTSVLAGLGIGGIALALGAQRTLENVFGAFALAVDQPIREGDLIRVGELIGQVESIGLRSTRIRTAERTVVSIPNGKLADLHLETFAARDRVRFVQRLSVRLETKSDQLQSLIDGCKKVLNDHEKLFPNSATVSVVALGPYAIDVEASAWFATLDLEEYRVIREGVLLELLKAVETSGAALAFPTSTVLVESQGAKPVTRA